MHYYIDGYNLLFRLTEFHGTFQQQREELIHELTAKLKALDIECTLIFDAMHSEAPLARHHLHDVEVVYTDPNQSADCYILEVLHNIDKPHLRTVVTSDRRLARQIRELGSKTVDVAPFMTWVNKRFHKLNLKLEDLTPPPKRAISSPKTSLEPSLSSNDDPLLKVFEQRFERLEAKTPSSKRSTPKARTPASRKKNTPKPLSDEEPIDEEQRWLDIFTRRSQDHKKN